MWPPLSIREAPNCLVTIRAFQVTEYDSKFLDQLTIMGAVNRGSLTLEGLY